MTRPNPLPGIFGHDRTMVTPHYAVMPLEGILESSPSDMAVNVLSVAPGTHFPFVETHIMEHGLYMLQGQGLCGSDEAAYLLYQDINRDLRFDTSR